MSAFVDEESQTSPLIIFLFAAAAAAAAHFGHEVVGIACPYQRHHRFGCRPTHWEDTPGAPIVFRAFTATTHFLVGTAAGEAAQPEVGNFVDPGAVDASCDQNVSGSKISVDGFHLCEVRHPSGGVEPRCKPF